MLQNCSRIFANAVANLINVLPLKRECKTWVSNLHNKHFGVYLWLISTVSFFTCKFRLTVHIRPAFCENVYTNARES